MPSILFVLSILLIPFCVQAQTTVLRPDRVFDGETMHTGWVVVVQGERIAATGPATELAIPPEATTIDLSGMTLSPGLIDAHSHVLLHPYNEASWNDQVLRESRSLRVARATVHAKNTLMAGWTTLRDLGSEGADYADVGIRQAIDQGIIPGPRMLVAGRAIVATGSYGPKGFHPDFEVPLGAEPADGVDDLIRVVRDQIGKGADVVKIYADYRWGPRGEAMPTFSLDEIKRVVAITNSTGRPVVAHAATARGMMNAILGGVETIEHGDGASEEVFSLMIEKGVVWMPTLAAGEAISSYGGWKKGSDPEPARITRKKEVFMQALEMGVIIGVGSDVGVFPHGDNAWELELMVEYGMTPLNALRAATSINADALHLDNQLGRVREGLLADLIAMEGDPSQTITATRHVRFVMKGGAIIRQP